MEVVKLEFTPLEFETSEIAMAEWSGGIRIYSVGVWNSRYWRFYFWLLELEFTPLEFETANGTAQGGCIELEFTPLEFETWLF